MRAKSSAIWLGRRALEDSLAANPEEPQSKSEWSEHRKRPEEKISDEARLLIWGFSIHSKQVAKGTIGKSPPLKGGELVTQLLATCLEERLIVVKSALKHK